uniref:protein SIEVE ELEMENT OCCLUSION B-like n=1 Tax=Erigeron canadensis TaxID=72917 RepID=UPI001CB97A19|nr:protein SIEVE ELEMENT OCCLUSION B-like [Erigeron canadensis]
MDASSSRHARDESHMFSSSDDNAMLKYILATHAPDDTYFDVKPFLEIIENIVHTANQDNQAEPGSTIERRFISNDVNEILEVMAITINKVCCEISSKCIGGGDAHTTTMGILNMLSNYTWDAKAVIALSAFALNYAEFLLVAQLYISNALAQSVIHLKQLPDMQESGDALKLQFQAITNLIKSMLDLIAHCIVEFKILPKQYISPETPELVIATTHIPAAVYWIIRSIVACASILINLIGKGQEHIVKTTDGWELSSLAHKISNFQDHLKNQLVLCYQHIEEKRQNEAYQTIVRIMDTPHRDNVTPLKHLIYSKDDQLPLYQGFTNNRVSIEALKKKIVLLLISDLDLSIEEYCSIDYYVSGMTMQTENKYEVVWLPVVPDDTETPFDEVHQRQFKESRSMMPWYSVCDPLLLQPAVIKYIKEDWHFNHKPILVVMDPQGRIVNTNALHMIWIWGIQAFPFTSQKEEALWKEETWRMGLLVGDVDRRISDWIADGKYICLYGGVDIEWIRKFTLIAKDVARAAEIPLEMMYVGKSNRRERLQRIIDIIERDNLSDNLYYPEQIWYFWVRLEKMLYSKSKHTKSSDVDPILQEINTMLTYDGNDEGWAVICRGSNDWMHRANGETVLTGLTNYKDWKDNAQEKGFLPALNDYLMSISSPHHCNRLILPGTTGPNRVACVECGRLMERFVMYRCCVD